MQRILNIYNTVDIHYFHNYFFFIYEHQQWALEFLDSPDL